MYRPADDPELTGVAKLGEGGTAEVVRAFHRSLQRTLAVKYVRPDSENPNEFTALAHRERTLIGGRRFGGLVRIIDDPEGIEDRLLLGLCFGPDLDRAGKIEDTQTALNVISAVALSLEYVRAVQLVHGDFKPQNVFLPADWSDCGDGRLFFARLSDFSLGRRFGEPEDSRLGLGTVGYMAPETISEKTTSHRSDLFALGVTAYQLLTGRHPFMEDGSDPVLINSRVCEFVPPPVHESRPDVPEALSDLVSRLLSKTPDERPETAWSVCLELEELGATYPFRQALRPEHLVKQTDAYDEIIGSYLNVSVAEKDRLLSLTDGDRSRLRLLLAANSRRGNMEYDGNRFAFRGRILWPCRMRRSVLRSFLDSTYSQQRAAVAWAVSQDRALCEASGFAPDESPPSAIKDILSPLLRPATVRRLASRLTKAAETAKNYRTAVRLRLRTGDLLEAERLADLAARQAMNESRYQDAIGVLREVELAARTAGRVFEVRRAVILRGNAHKDCGELDRADQAYGRVVSSYEDQEPDKSLAETYKHLGELHRLRHNSRLALESLQKSLEVFEALGDELEISHTLTNIGNVHWLLDDTATALKKYRAAYKIQRRLQIPEDVASTLHNIATVVVLSGKLNRGIFLLEAALKMKREIGHAGEIARTLNNLGSAYQLKGVPAKSVEYLAESLDLNRKIGSAKEILYNIENLTTLRISAGQLDEAMNLLKEGIDLAGENNREAHSGIFWLRVAEIAIRRGDYREAEAAMGRVDQVVAQYDEYGLALLTDLRRAEMRLFIGDVDRALEIATGVYSKAKENNVSQVVQECVPLLARLTNDSETLAEGEATIVDQHLVREARLIKFGRAEFLWRQGHGEEAYDVIAADLSDLTAIEDDIDLPRLALLAAELMLQRGETDPALRLCNRAERMATAMGLLPEKISTLLVLGRIHRERGDYETAFSSFRLALTLARQIMNTIDSDADRQFYQRTPTIQSLSEQIKSLGEILGQQQRAGR